jgi:hypothetical protein
MVSDVDAAVARCIEIIREQQAVFLSPQYATGQPFSSFQERFACGRCIEAIEEEFASLSPEGNPHG